MRWRMTQGNSKWSVEEAVPSYSIESPIKRKDKPGFSEKPVCLSQFHIVRPKKYFHLYSG